MDSPYDPTPESAYVRDIQARLAVVEEQALSLEAQAQEIPPLRAIKDAVRDILAQDHPASAEAGHALAVAYLEWARAWGTPEHPPDIGAHTLLPTPHPPCPHARIRIGRMRHTPITPMATPTRHLVEGR